MPFSNRSSRGSKNLLRQTKDREADSNNIESGSYHSSHASRQSTQSISSSVRCFHKENGRTYHGYRAGSYHFPNDPTEVERLDFQFYIIQHALKEKLAFVPVPKNAKVLDIGTGTGTWAVQMGDSYPDATIEATDLSPIQPSAAPPNVQFIIDDAEQEDWAVPNDYYDYVHTRILMGCFQDFRQIIRKGFQHTKPGGYMESSDIAIIPACDDGSMPADWPFLIWSRDIEEASMDAGRPLLTAVRLKQWYIEAGFVDVHEKVVKLPINAWPKNKDLKALGKWWGENMLMGLQGFSLALLFRINGWTTSEIELYLAPVRVALKDRHVHAYHKFHIVTGRKPLESPKPDACSSVASIASSAEYSAHLPERRSSVIAQEATMARSSSHVSSEPALAEQSSMGQSEMQDTYEFEEGQDTPDPVATQWYHAHMLRLNTPKYSSESRSRRKQPWE